MKLLMSLAVCFVTALFCFAQPLDMKGLVGNSNPSPAAQVSTSNDVWHDFPHYYTPPSMQPIPGGEYEMGGHGGGPADALPIHTVYVDSFLMDTFEVTNKQYSIFLNAAFRRGEIEVTNGNVLKKNPIIPYCKTAVISGHSRITWDGVVFGTKAGKANHPMVLVSWYGAIAYANWLSEQEGLTPCYDFSNWHCDFSADGFRLPTEAEWEFASRGGNHNPYYIFPWGDWPDQSNGNFSYSNDPFEWPEPIPHTTPAGYYDSNQIPPGGDMANGYGLYDIAGNVAEWCNDWYDEDYYSNSPYDNPKGPSIGTVRSLRDGGWQSIWFYNGCAPRRYWKMDTMKNSFGFRLVRKDA